jgi:protein translocase, SecG subunit
MEIVLCLFSLFLIAVVLLQSGRSAGLTGDIAGGAETFLGKSKAKGYEGTLKKLTKVTAVGMMILAVALVLIQVYVLGAETPDEATTPDVSSTPAPLTNPSESVSAETSEEATVEATIEASAEISAEATVSPEASPTTTP